MFQMPSLESFGYVADWSDEARRNQKKGDKKR
jgi:hypothetical protein